MLIYFFTVIFDLSRASACDQFFSYTVFRKGFLHRIVTEDEKLIHYENLKRKASWIKPGETDTSTQKQNIHDSKFMMCIWWYQNGVIYYKLLNHQKP